MSGMIRVVCDDIVVAVVTGRRSDAIMHNRIVVAGLACSDHFRGNYHWDVDQETILFSTSDLTMFSLNFR